MQCNPDASRAQSSRVGTVKMVTGPAFVVSASGAKTIWRRYGTFDRDCRVTELFAMTGKETRQSAVRPSHQPDAAARERSDRVAHRTGGLRVSPPRGCIRPIIRR